MAILTSTKAAQRLMRGSSGRRATKATQKYDGLTLNELNEFMETLSEKPKLSYENSKRLLGLACSMHSAINDISAKFNMSREKVTSEINKYIYELAEEKKCSIYDICYHFAPVEKNFRVDYPKDPRKGECTMTSDIQLVPIEFEFEKGPGYWKGKYFRLKEKLQKLIDDKKD